MMNTIAADETTRKNGRRSESGRLRRKLQAPPGFCAKMKSRCPLSTSTLRTGETRGSSPERRDLAQPLDARSAASEITVTTVRNVTEARGRGPEGTGATGT